MLEALYTAGEDKRVDPDSVTDFRLEFVSQKDEDLFYQAIHDTHYAGFIEGMKAALVLTAELL